MTNHEFATIANYIEKNVGIKMPPTKRIMMQSRLTHRLRHLGLSSYKEYIDYVFNHDTNGEELILMIDSLTTNKTDFFREPDHFKYLTSKVLPEFAAAEYSDLKVWSAACSSGEEPYTLAIVLSEYMRTNQGAISSFSITASDISTKVLGKAMNAVYDISEIEIISNELKKRYFLRGKGENSEMVRVKPELRQKVHFMRLNFMDEVFAMPERYKVIFCRNVLIYFDKPTQEAVIRKLLRHLQTGGYLFLGHSETIVSMNLPLQSVAPTVYKKIGDV
ncbi:MAG: hypothetical protein NC041_06760 [Bacteroides sp.]|nr:hypothetical protein [Prevotella sp.]MCM1406997.1 chemotaxis protein CheR [Treponema brennaborense]MCM1470148.1 hypothetical protein [Bacteroides sp.]